MSARTALTLVLLAIAADTTVPAAALAGSERRDRPRAVTLEAPRYLTVLDYTPRVVITWTWDGAHATGFEVERATLSGPVQPDRFTRVGAPGRDARRFRDPTSHTRTTYVYRIRAVGAGTASPWSSELIVRVLGTAR